MIGKHPIHQMFVKEVEITNESRKIIPEDISFTKIKTTPG